MVGVKNAKNIILEWGGGGVKPCEGTKGSKRKGDAGPRGVLRSLHVNLIFYEPTTAVILFPALEKFRFRIQTIVSTIFQIKYLYNNKILP
jgi:hypothetical protein